MKLLKQQKMIEAIQSLVKIAEVADVYAILDELKYQYAKQCVAELRYHEHAAKALNISVPTLRSWLRLTPKKAV